MAEPNNKVRFTVQRTWPQAFWAWVKDGHTSLILKILVGYGPVAILNDLIPGLGLIDNLYLPVWIVVLVVVFLQVSTYRYKTAPQPTERKKISSNKTAIE